VIQLTAAIGEQQTLLEQNSILIVDDNVDLSDALAEALRSEGYAVILASNGQEALVLLPRLKRPCGIVLDIAMPVMSGTDFYERMTALPAFADIPVVVFAADPSLAPSGLARIEKSSPAKLFAVLAALFLRPGSC
jgi:CheY-like chemotaxis protein